MTLLGPDRPAASARTVSRSATARTRPDADRAGMGAVYTPAVLAEWTASLIGQAATAPVTSVLDPACGEGALLDAARRELPDVTRLEGFDLSPTAVATAVETLVDGPRAASLSITCRDALTTTSDDVPETAAVIMNPPWGADMTGRTPRLRQAGYTLANGQFDSWDLFVEWTLREPAPGTIVAAILPDSIFQPEHHATRRLLLENSQLNVVARLGEGWFDDVFRGVAVLVYTTGTATTAPVRTVRIDHAARRRIFAGKTTLTAEAAQSGHTMDPARWAADPHARFGATTSVSDSPWAGVLDASGGDWTRWFTIGRGVEMGASGELHRCDRCGWHRGPTKDSSVCRNCGRPTDWHPVRAITAGPVSGSVPLIVGRDVRRYGAEPSRWLRTDLAGVAYKDADLYTRPKLLVRKTGLGLNAAVDRSGSHTNQVVFHYVPRPEAPDWVLHYVEGVLCSRTMLAFHLSRTGETEWRSHPYVTPKVLATLPVPVPDDEQTLRQARTIADAAAPLHRAGDAPACGEQRPDRPALEQRVDELVAGLYGLDDDGCAWVDAVLAQTQTLDAFAHLRTAAPLRAVIA